MIAVKLEGGLGNQMFQYAFGRALSVKHNVPLYYDTVFFDKWQPNPLAVQRFYELDVFPVQALALNSSARKKFFPSASVLSRSWHKFQRIAGCYKMLYERKYGYDEKMGRESSKKIYIIGYWQSSQYFESIASIIRQDFTLNLDMCNRNLEIEDQIRSQNSVCIHVRRGDYVNNPNTLQIHGMTEMNYYEQSIALIEKKLGAQLRYFIFSDDTDWCRRNFKWLSNSMIVERSNSTSPAYDMYLMSLCRHFIIANSTFSWWAAWLGNNQKKMVIAPRKWFADMTSEELQMHPKDWIVI